MATALSSSLVDPANDPSLSNIYARLNAFPQSGPHGQQELAYPPPLSAPPRMESPTSMSGRGSPAHPPSVRAPYADYRQSYAEQNTWDTPSAQQVLVDEPAFGADHQQQQQQAFASSAAPQRASQHESMSTYVFPPPNGYPSRRMTNDDTLGRGQQQQQQQLAVMNAAEDPDAMYNRGSGYVVEAPPPQASQQYRERPTNSPRRPSANVSDVYGRSESRPRDDQTPDETLYARAVSYFDTPPTQYRERTTSSALRSSLVEGYGRPTGELSPLGESIPEEPTYAVAQHQPPQHHNPHSSQQLSQRAPANVDVPEEEEMRYSRAPTYRERPPTGPRRPSADTRMRVSTNVDSMIVVEDAYARASQFRDRTPSMVPSGAPRHPSVPGGSISGPVPITPMSAGPNYGNSAQQQSVPAASSPKLRAPSYAQQPTYVNVPTPSAPNAAAVYTPTSPKPLPGPAPRVVPQEEVCVECAMRDQDMADVDVTSPGVWERESDVAYHELCQREAEEEAAGIPQSNDPSVVRSTGDMLTEYNLKIWLAINPKEPTSKQQTLNAYVKSQRALLEAEALAHSRAIAESRNIEHRMRDTYSQLRRSAYETGASPIDEVGGVRIKAPRSLSIPMGASVPVRDATLLANGLIVEHVDVRREEREEKERRRKEERSERSRARKSSRGSGGPAADVQSVYSLPSPAPHTDSGYASGQQRLAQRQSQFSLASSQNRPVSTISTPLSPAPDRPGLPRAYSQYSLSESVSSPRRSKFFGKSLSPGWKSQDSLAPSGISGSMIDMHVALDRHHPPYPPEVGQLPSSRLSEGWRADDQYEAERAAEEKANKKRKGLLKIWKIVTGASRGDNHRNGDAERGRSMERANGNGEDDGPLAPPPPLTYLMNRSSGEGPRHTSMPSLSASSGNFAMPGMSLSPNTAPSSALPSPVSSRKSGPDAAEAEGMPGYEHPAEIRDREPRASVLLSPGAPLKRDKSLPPLPHEVSSAGAYPTPRAYTISESRPATMFYDSRGHMSSDVPTQHGLLAPNAPFRSAETRRQSFGGMSSRPDLGYQTLPASAGYAQGNFGAPEPGYGEFGMSRRSLGRFDSLTPEPTGTMKTARKRRSKFALSSLFGRKSTANGKDTMSANSPSMSPVPPVMPVSAGGGGMHEFPVYGPTSSSEEEYARRARSPQATMTMTRMSVASRKAIEELVDQDREFVAYRYPSNDQAFDVHR